MANELTAEQLTAVNKAIYADNKIEAIKIYRSATGKDLKDSKDAVEKLAAELKAQNPAMFMRQRKQVSSLAGLMLWAAIALIIIYFASQWK
ncbi:MAG: ribosomal protein L7/L12 [Gammaproteobacteria bacterium]|nr:ribosomal protein L7/L12 [Gammaproteobacteria bacterium]